MLTLAVPRGRLLGEARDLLGGAGFPAEAVEEDARLLVDAGELRLLLARPADVVVFVREGAADLGITGRDSLLEDRYGCCELLDLGIGRCRLSVAGRLPEGLDWQGFLAARGSRLRVATKHPEATRQYFASLGLEPVVIRLGGALELAPQVGLADVIVDLVQTGRTLAANGLEELAVIAEVTARLIANPVSLRFKGREIGAFMEKLKGARRAQGVGLC